MRALILVLLAGCAPEPITPKQYVPVPVPEKKTALVTKHWDGIVRGKVSYDGDPPTPEPIKRINDHGDKAGCVMGITHTETWVVDKASKAVANVVVWVEPPPGKYFTLRDQDKKRDKELVIMDQPHCAFVPHVVTLFPSYFDGDKQVLTGQKFEVRNSAPFAHTAQWDGTRENDSFGGAGIPPNGGKLQFVLKPQRKALHIGCGLHSWMRAVAWIFDHPYHTVSNTDGSFQIENIPTGVEFVFKAWHESRAEPFEQRSLTLKPGENPAIELRIKR